MHRRSTKRIGFAASFSTAGTVVIGLAHLCRADTTGRAVQQTRPKPRSSDETMFGYSGFGDTHLFAHRKATLSTTVGEASISVRRFHTRHPFHYLV